MNPALIAAALTLAGVGVSLIIIWIARHAP